MSLGANVLATLTELTAGLVQAIKDAGLEDPCMVTVMPGADVSLDYCNSCTNGMAWVRLVDITQQEGTGTLPSVCGVPFNANLEMGWMVGAPTLSEQGELPDADDQTQSATRQLHQMDVMRNAFCLTTLSTGWPVNLTSYTPFGPQGGCIGGLWQATVAVD